MGLFYMITDHLGKTYKSFSAMCKAYGLLHPTVRARLDRGFTLEEALTSRLGGRPVWIKGKKYDSIVSACEVYGIKPSTAQNRIWNLGYCTEDAITLSREELKDVPEERKWNPALK